MKPLYTKEHLLSEIYPEDKITFLELLGITSEIDSVIPKDIDLKLKKFYETAELSVLENFFNKISKELKTCSTLYSLYILAENTELQKNSNIVSCIKTLMLNRIFVEVIIGDPQHGFHASWLYNMAKKNLEEKKIVLEMFSKNMPYPTSVFPLCSEEFKNDIDIAKAAIGHITHDGKSWLLNKIFSNIGENLKQNKDFILQILDQKKRLKKLTAKDLETLLDKKFFFDEDIIKRLLKGLKKAELFNWLSTYCSTERDMANLETILHKIVKKEPAMLQYIPMKTDKHYFYDTAFRQLLHEISQTKPAISEYFPEEIIKTEMFFMEWFIDANYENINYLSPDTKLSYLKSGSWKDRKDEKFFIKLCFRFPGEFRKKIFRYIPSELKTNINFLSMLVKFNPNLMNDLSDNLKIQIKKSAGIGLLDSPIFGFFGHTKENKIRLPWEIIKSIIDYLQPDIIIDPGLKKRICKRGEFLHGPTFFNYFTNSQKLAEKYSHDLLFIQDENGAWCLPLTPKIVLISIEKDIFDKKWDEKGYSFFGNKTPTTILLMRNIIKDKTKTEDVKLKTIIEILSARNLGIMRDKDVELLYGYSLELSENVYEEPPLQLKKN